MVRRIIRLQVSTALLLVGLTPGVASGQDWQTSTSTMSPGGPGGPRFESAPDPEPVPEPPPPPPITPRRRSAFVPDGEGSVLASGVLGLSAGTGGARLVLGAGVGYALFDGVVPGVRGLAVFGNGLGGELALNLILTLPMDWYVVPFVTAEGGRRWLDGLSGWIVGAGGGGRIGWASSPVALRFGWIWRRFIVDGVSYDVSAPLFSVQYRW